MPFDLTDRAENAAFLKKVLDQARRPISPRISPRQKNVGLKKTFIVSNRYSGGDWQNASEEIQRILGGSKDEISA